MKNYTKEQLQEILEKHLAWLNDDDDGRRADLRLADLSGADLSEANLSGANLSEANLSEADLSEANLSGANGLALQSVFIQSLERDEKGFITYKTFGEHYSMPEKWTIKPCEIITENCCTDRTNDCGCGVNVATLEWVQKNTRGDVWKVRIPFGALIIVPYISNGKFRTEQCELIEQIDRE